MPSMRGISRGWVDFHPTLPVISPSRRMPVLDPATGHGHFAIALARCCRDVTVMGIDLCENDIGSAKRCIAAAGFENRILIQMIDATNMGFADASFNGVVDFLGLEDIRMTRGRMGVHKAVAERWRMLRSGGDICPVVMPPEEMETEAQVAEVALFSCLCGATWLSKDDCRRKLENVGFAPLTARKYHTGKKLTPQQARSEIRFACKNLPNLYGIAPKTYEDDWNRCDKTIEKNGLGH